MKKEYSNFKEIISKANAVLVIQADNPDGDSLSSALALEQILIDLGKEAHLYCAVDIPGYLKHIPGWDRVEQTIPNQFDVSIIVDTSAVLLLEKLETSKYKNMVAKRPVIVLDHHAGVECDIPYATLVINDADAVSTGEVIYKLATNLKWPINLDAKKLVATSILADSMGLTTEGTTADTYRTMADLVESGVDRPRLEEARREYSKMPQTIYRYKAELIGNTLFYSDDRIALVAISHDEIMKYSPLYNPAPLIQSDMLQTEGVSLAIVLKKYNDSKVTGSLRANSNGCIAGDLAKSFGGGGHKCAAGFKIANCDDFSVLKQDIIKQASELLDKLAL